jgi:C-terminal processing protease CtpA/Prc
MAKKMQSSGWVGVELEGIEEGPGNLVVAVVEGSPAEEAGLQKGDILMAINGIELIDENMGDIEKLWKTMTPGTEVVWTMKRDDHEMKHNIRLAAMPADVLARYIGRHMLQHAHTEVASTEEEHASHN